MSLNDASRRAINAAFLSGTDAYGRAEGRYQAVVLPNNAPFPAGSAEMAALQSYEAQFGVRQVDAYTYAQPAVGLNWAASPGYIGALDGMQGSVTTAGLGGAFRYLKGSVPFEDNDPNVTESYGYLATPVATQASGASFTPLVTMPIPNGGVQGVLAGEYAALAWVAERLWPAASGPRLGGLTALAAAIWSAQLLQSLGLLTRATVAVSAAALALLAARLAGVGAGTAQA